MLVPPLANVVASCAHVKVPVPGLDLKILLKSKLQDEILNNKICFNIVQIKYNALIVSLLFDISISKILRINVSIKNLSLTLKISPILQSPGVLVPTVLVALPS